MIRAKGLDDLLRLGGRPRLRAFHPSPAELGNRRRPRLTGSVGPVAKGSSLTDVRQKVKDSIHGFFVTAAPTPGHAQLLAASPGSGKTTELVTAAKNSGLSVRLVVGTKAFAGEVARDYGLQLIEARSPKNCTRYDVVTALGSSGHDVERLACGRADAPRCPSRASCAYFTQFAGTGHRVGTAEQLFNRHFMAGGEVVALDDADLSRLVVQSFVLREEALIRVAAALPCGPIRDLLLFLVTAVHVTERSKFGAGAWEQLAAVANLHNVKLVELVEVLTSAAIPEPSTTNGGRVLSRLDVEAAPPAALRLILEALRAELPRFLSGEEFNGRLCIHPGAVEVRVLRPSPWADDREGRRDRPSVIVLDATPVDALVDHVLAGFTRLEDVRSAVALPPQVTVHQYTTASNSYASLGHPEARQRVLREVCAARELHPVSAPDKEAVIAPKALRADLEGIGFSPAHILGFGSVRGSNVLASVERLHIIGRPMPPTDDILYDANIIWSGEAPVSRELVMRSRAFGGQPWEIDYLDFADPRASALLKSERDDEIVQAMHRARLHLADDSRRVTLVIHGSHPIDGLRVDQLHVDSERSRNDDRQTEATERILNAERRLSAAGRPVTQIAVAREARAHVKTVRAVRAKASSGAGNELHTLIEIERAVDQTTQDGDRGLVGNALHTLIEDEPTTDDAIPAGAACATGVGKAMHTPIRDLSKGVHCLPQTATLPLPTSEQFSDGLALGPRPDRPHWTECPGRCGSYVPPGQKCFACAAQATRLWAAQQRREFSGVG